jgi:hypothetical protein
MRPNRLVDPAAKPAWSVVHPLSQEDSAAAAALQAIVIDGGQYRIG